MTIEALPESRWCPRGHGVVRARRADCPVCAMPLARLIVDRFGAQQWSWAEPDESAHAPRWWRPRSPPAAAGRETLAE